MCLVHSSLSCAELYVGTDPAHSPAIAVVCTVVILMVVLAWPSVYCIQATLFTNYNGYVPTL